MKARSIARDPQKAGTGKTLAWSSHTLAQTVCYTLVSSYMMYYCTDIIGLDIALVGTLLLASKIIDAITDLVAGLLVDNTHTRFGKGRPYEFALIGMWLATWAMFSAPAEASTAVKAIWVLISYIFINSVFATLMGAAEPVYMIRAFGSKAAISKVSSLGGVISAVSGMIVMIVVPQLMKTIVTDASGWSKMVLLIAVPAVLIGMLRFLFVKETHTPEEDKKSEQIKMKDVLTLYKNNPYIWMLGLLFLVKGFVANIGMTTHYFTYIVGDVGKQSTISALSILGMVLLLGFPVLLKKMSTSQLSAVCCVLSIIGGIVNWFARDNMTLLVVGAILGNMATLPISFFLGLMIMNCSSYNEMVGIRRLEGTVGAIPNFFNKIGGGLGAWAVGIIVGAAGFDSSLAVQSDAALNAIRFSYGLLPAILWVVAIFAALQFHKLEKTVADHEKAQCATEE